MKLEIELDVPDHLIDESFEQQMRVEAVLRLFADDKISAAVATRALRLTRVQFLQLLEQRGIPLVAYTAEDFRRDMEDVDAILKGSGQP